MNPNNKLELGLHCSAQLKILVENNKQRILGLGEAIDEAASEEKYEKAALYKTLQSEVKNSTYRLERILDGFPAFDEPINETSTG